MKPHSLNDILHLAPSMRSLVPRNYFLSQRKIVMRIIIDGRMILPQMTGVGRYLLGFVGALRKIPCDDHFEMWIQTDLPADHPVWRLANERLKLRRVPIGHFDVRSTWYLPFKLAHSRPNLLHYPHFDLPWTVPGKVVATIHDLKYVARRDFFPHLSSLKRLTILLSISFTTRRARQIITDSQSTKQDLIRRLHITPNKIIVVPLGVEDLFFNIHPLNDIQTVRSRYGLEDPFIIYVGERRPHKNIAGVIEAFELFRRMVDTPYTLAIVGKPYLNYRIPEILTQKLGLKTQIRFFDYISDMDLSLLYQAADAYVLLSFYEGFGLPVLEAMASGTPTVISNMTSLPEVTGDAGLLVAPNNPEQAALSIKKVVPGGEMRELCIHRGLERARQFTWEQCAHKTLDVYHKAVSQ